MAIECKAASGGADFIFDTVTTDSFSMDCIRFGSGNGTLVILPGLSVQSVMRSAEAVVQAYAMFSECFTVYLFDRRKDIPDIYTVEDMARDTAEAFIRLGLRDACVFGASQGGMIAMEIAACHPELLKKVIIGSSSVSVQQDRVGTVEKWICIAKSGDAEALYLAFGEDIYPKELFEATKDLLIEAANTVSQTDLTRFVIMAEGLRGFDMTGRMNEIDCPVLVIGDKDDRVLGPGASQQIYELLRDHTEAELHMYEGYGHAVYDTAPDYRELMMRFLIPSDKGPLTLP